MLKADNRNNLFKFLLLFLILSFSVPLDPLWTVREMSVSTKIAQVIAGSLVRQIALLCLGGYALAILFSNRRKYHAHINNFHSTVVLFYLFWATISIFWADNIVMTSKSIVALFLISLGAFALSLRFSIKEILEFAFFGCGLTLLIGLICEVILNTFNPLAGDYRFSGVMHMNAQGENCAVLFIASIYLSIVSKRHKVLFLVCGITAFAFLLLTKSRTAAMSAILVFILGLVLFYPKSFKGIVSLIFSVIFIVFFCFVFLEDETTRVLNSAGEYIGTMGRQPEEASDSISDRKLIWHECMQYASARPLTGYGYGGFWTPRHIDAINAAVGRGAVASCHSNYIELLLDIGPIGALAFVFILLYGMKKSFNLLKKSGRNADMIITTQLLCFLFFTSLFEMNVNMSNIHIFVIYVLISKVAFVNDRIYEKDAFA